MTKINTISELLEASNVSELAPKNFSKIFRYIGKSQAPVSKMVFSELATVMKNSTEATTLAYKGIQSIVESANERADESSLSHMGNVINLLHENGVSDKRIDDLLPELLQHKHEIQKTKTEGNYGLAKTALGIAGGLAAIFLAGKAAEGVVTKNNQTKPRKFWES